MSDQEGVNQLHEKLQLVTKESQQPTGQPVVSKSFPRQRRIFDKYSDSEKSLILWKVSLALTVFSLTLACTGLFMNQFDDDNIAEVELNGHKVSVPSITTGSSSLTLGTEGCDNGWKVDPNMSKLFSPGGMTFKELKDGAKDDPAGAYFLDDSKRLISLKHSGTWEGIYQKALTSRMFGILGVAFQGIALIWMVGSKKAPSPFLFSRPLFGQTSKDHQIGMVPAILLFVSGAMLLVSISIMSAVMPAILSRVADFALDWCSDSPFDSLPRGQDSLEYMKFLGEYLQEHADAQGVTFMTYATSISLVYVHTMVLFYLAIKEVRKSAVARNNSTFLPDSQAKALPWYARIWPIQYSLGLVIIAMLMNFVAIYSTRVRGYPLNIFFYNVKFLATDNNSAADNNDSSISMSSNDHSWSLSDVLLDNVHQYVVDKSIVKLLLFGWFPTMFLWGSGTCDMQKFTSKATQSLGIVMLFGALLGMSTVPPTPAFVLQKPQCYAEPHRPPTFVQFFSISESCNDQIYSLYAVLMVLPGMVQWYYIRYGAIKRKVVAYSVLLAMLSGSLLLVIVTRQQYTVDVYIGALATILFCLTQGPAYKLLFRFGIVYPTTYLRSQIILSDKVVSVIDDCIHRFELFFMATGRSGSHSKFSRDDLLQIQSEFNNLLEAIKYAKEKSLIDAATILDNSINSGLVGGSSFSSKPPLVNAGTSIHDEDDESTTTMPLIEEADRNNRRPQIIHVRPSASDSSSTDSSTASTPDPGDEENEYSNNALSSRSTLYASR